MPTTTTTTATAAAAAATTMVSPSACAVLRSSARCAGTLQRNLLRDEICSSLNPAQTRALLARWTLRSTEYDAVTILLLLLSCVNVLIMYLIIFDWLYKGHVALLHGEYGLDDDDDDDDVYEE
jgi:hypothetical protein